VLHANSNGYLTLVAVTGSAGDFSPTLGELVNISVGTHSSLPRLCPAWYDFHASRNVSLNPNAGVYFEEDAVNQTATVTWLDVGEFATAAAGGASHSFQVHINANGTVEYRYGPMTPFPSNSSPKIIGFTPGAPGVVPVSQDLSATMTFLSSLADSVPLSLAVTGTLIAGGSITATTDGVPGPLPGTVITFLGDTQIPLGFDLGGIGMPDCSAYLDVTTAIGMLLSGTPTAALSIPIPNNPALGGRSFYLQSGAFDASMQNAFGALTSNGVRLVIGNVQ